MMTGLGVVAAAATSVSPLFALLSLVLILAVLVSLVLIKLRQSLLVGYLLCGVVIANAGLMPFAGGAEADAVISHLAEIGVILLMFTLGIEFSLGELSHLRRMALLGGGLQVLLTSAVAAAVALSLGFPMAEAVVLAVAVALSSTAVAMKSFQDLGQPNHPAARAALSVALFQDLLVIVFILILPAIFGKGEGSVVMGIGGAILKGLLFLGGALVLGRYGITPLLHAVARTRSRELFTLTVVALCSGVALAGGALDLSLALGAFAAGLVVSESIYSHRIMADILPFKDLFLAIFFISVGLQIDLTVVAAEWPKVVVGCLLIFALKGGIVFTVTRLMKLPLKPALLTAAALASTGEFSLVLMGKAEEYRSFDPAVVQLLLICSAVTMGLVPTLMRATSPVGRWLERRGWFQSRKPLSEPLAPTKAIKELSDHAVICGYGPVGHALNEALKRCGVDTLVMELNSDTVRELKKEGQLVLFADATHPEALDLAGIGRARLVAFTFPAVEMTCAAVPLVRERNPGIVLFGRAKYPAEVERLRNLDVQVVHDERESAVAMVRAAMKSYQRADIDPEEVVKAIVSAE
ncbi:MAG: cation:proton antiporter [Verrucomicrobiales bacterium]